MRTVGSRAPNMMQTMGSLGRHRDHEDDDDDDDGEEESIFGTSPAKGRKRRPPRRRPPPLLRPDSKARAHTADASSSSSSVSNSGHGATQRASTASKTAKRNHRDSPASVGRDEEAPGDAIDASVSLLPPSKVQLTPAEALAQRQNTWKRQFKERQRRELGLGADDTPGAHTQQPTMSKRRKSQGQQASDFNAAQPKSSSQAGAPAKAPLPSKPQRKLTAKEAEMESMMQALGKLPSAEVALEQWEKQAKAEAKAAKQKQEMEALERRRGKRQGAGGPEEEEEVVLHEAADISGVRCTVKVLQYDEYVKVVARDEVSGDDYTLQASLFRSHVRVTYPSGPDQMALYRRLVSHLVLKSIPLPPGAPGGKGCNRV